MKALLLASLLVAVVSFADEYVVDRTECQISGTVQSLANLSVNKLKDALNIRMSMVSARDLDGKITNLSKRFDSVSLQSGTKIPASLLLRFKDANIEYQTLMSCSKPGDMKLQSPSMKSLLTKADLFELITLLSGNVVDQADPWKIQWRNREGGNKCMLYPAAKQTDPSPIVEFVYGDDLYLLYQVNLPPNVKDGLSYHLTVRCERR